MMPENLTPFICAEMNVETGSAVGTRNYYSVTDYLLLGIESIEFIDLTLRLNSVLNLNFLFTTCGHPAEPGSL